ncbi:MAG: type II toxin-antitoxin system RelE/ParE family toxin [Bacteroidetes bacterium]|nr:type II toxin-antitoxin system RelE/ParE family toxin [Bacteroidota bacterium]
MAYYKILWKKSAAKELKNIDKQIIPKIISTVESLSKNPFPLGVKKLSGAEFNYRIRVGDYRIIYSFYKKELTIEIIRVGHRRDVYKK